MGEENRVMGLCQSKVSSGQVSLGRGQKAPSLCGEEGEMTPPGPQARRSRRGVMFSNNNIQFKKNCMNR